MTDKVTMLTPFNANEINTIPKPWDSKSPRSKCSTCGGVHGQPALHLDYVGHAALTKRLLEVDPNWSWEPMAFSESGLPQFDNLGGMWGRLTVLGVTRIGYGDAQGKTGPNAIKEVIGDFLRNAGMRFGAALDLWHKGDLFEAQVEQGDENVIAPPIKAKKLADAEVVPEWTEEELSLISDIITEAKTMDDLETLKAFYRKYEKFNKGIYGTETFGLVAMKRRVELEALEAKKGENVVI